jgi:hypothetical protein
VAVVVLFTTRVEQVDQLVMVVDQVEPVLWQVLQAQPTLVAEVEVVGVVLAEQVRLVEVAL